MDSENPSAETNEEHYRYDDSIVRLFIGATAIWGLVASLAVAASIYILLNPGLIAAEYNFARFGNLPLSLTVYGFAANALFAGIYFSTQRLCKCEMWNRSLSWLHFFGWQFVNVWALVTIFYGHTEHRFGQDWVWVVDAGFALVMLCFATNLMMTLLRRRQRHMYISLWFYMSGALAPPMFQLLCNLAIPGEGYAGDSLFWGVADGFLQHWGFECIQYYMLLMPAIGLMYYFVPKATGKPVVHYRMAILQFWAMNTLGVFAATRVLHYSAVPEWITSLAMLAGVVMFFPSWGGVMAGWSMLRGPNKELLKSPILQFYLFGLIFFGFVCIEIGLTSIKSISSWTVFTDWGVAHSYAISFGVAGMFGIGAIFWMIPQLFHRALFNKNMLRINVFVSGIGAGVLVDASFLAGAIQGYKNTSIDATGTLNYEFVEILASVKPLWWAAMAGALIFAVGVLL
ncbi:MAG: cbb3-type cytochrome c oxidase subunit I, partial [Planctomycetota bacterium]